MEWNVAFEGSRPLWPYFLRIGKDVVGYLQI